MMSRGWPWHRRRSAVLRFGRTRIGMGLKEARMSSEVTPLAHDEEGWRSIDDRRALRFRMRHDGGAIVCVVPSAVLQTLPGIHPSSTDEEIFRAFEPHLARFETIADEKHAAGSVVKGEIVLDEG